MENETNKQSDLPIIQQMIRGCSQPTYTTERCLRADTSQE